MVYNVIKVEIAPFNLVSWLLEGWAKGRDYY